jgi:tRNA-specific 2-thiouridylase
MAQELVAVAMSGGVDSSVAAALLARQGVPIVGITLQLLPCEDQPLGGACCSLEAAMQARSVADRLGVDHVLVDARGEFERFVLKPCWEAYSRGQTPNPCVLCNQDVKWGVLFAKARALGATRVATGHYAQVGPGSGRTCLRRGLDPAKDQSYFLFSLSQAQLDVTVMPLGGLTKVRVRELAREFGLATAERPESQDACFSISEDGFGESLRLRFDAGARPGNIVDESGAIVGRHEGLHRFTLGQRRGLGISVGGRAFVKELRAATNEVVVTLDEKRLWTRRLVIALAGARDVPLPSRVHAQIRSRHRAVPASVTGLAGERAELVFDEAQRAVTPGQATVLYEGDRVVGGGWILEGG